MKSCFRLNMAWISYFSFCFFSLAFSLVIQFDKDLQFKKRSLFLRKKRVRMKVQVVDVSGGNSYETFATVRQKRAHGVMAMFDLTNRTSFQSLQLWVDRVTLKSPRSVPAMILVGNKADRIDQRKVSSREAQVSLQTTKRTLN